MTNDFEIKILIYSIILGVLFAFALILALRHSPGRRRRQLQEERRKLHEAQKLNS